MAQQVKFIKVQTYDKYASAIKSHPYAIVFGEFANDKAIEDASAAVTNLLYNINLPKECGFPVGTKLIYANGIQYDVTNLNKISGINSSINELYELVSGLDTDLGQDYLDLSTYVHKTVDGSISDISTKVIDISTRLNNVSTKTNDLSTYVHTTVDGSISDISTKVIDISTRLNNVSTRLNNVSTGLADLSTYVRTTVNGSISNISTRLSGALTNASIYAEAGTDSSVKIALETKTEGGTSVSTGIKVNGSKYVNVQHTNDAVSVSLQNITTASSDIIANSEKLVKAGDLYNYISTEISNLEGALQFKGGVNASTLDKLANPETGDVYVATGEFEFNGNNVENGDLLIYGNKEGWVIVERNLDGAVSATAELVQSRVTVGDGNHTVKTTDFVLPNVDNSTGIAGATANTSVLTTEYAVKDYVDNKLAAEVEGVKVSVSTGTKDYVSVSVDETGRDISVGVITAKLGDYADLTYNNTTGEWVTKDGSVYPDGLATASDVVSVIQDNEQVVAHALNTFKDKVGLDNNLSIDWGDKYTAGTTIVEAIKNINVAGAIDALNSSVAAAAGKVLTKVVQENGKLTAKEEATLKINNVSFTADSSAISVLIDADDIKLVMTDDEATTAGVTDADNPTIKQAIFDLRDGKIGSIYTGNNATVTDANSMELTSAFTKHNINNSYNFLDNVNKDASILTELLVTKTNTSATALATDAYVQEQITTAVTGALVWEEGFD